FSRSCSESHSLAFPETVPNRQIVSTVTVEGGVPVTYSAMSSRFRLVPTINCFDPQRDRLYVAELKPIHGIEGNVTSTLTSPWRRQLVRVQSPPAGTASQLVAGHGAWERQPGLASLIRIQSTQLLDGTT